MTTNSHPKGVLNANYSDNRAKKKELFFRYRVRANAVIDAFQKHSIIKDSIRLLDLGAADGKTLAFMAAELPISDAVGVEYNQNLIDCAGDLISAENKTSLVRGDVTDLVAINSASFDLVSALALLEHISDPSKVIAEAARVLKPGGLFVATSPVPFWDHIAVKTGLLKEDHHECDMHAEKFKSFVHAQTDLELVEFRPFMFAPIGVLPYLGLQPSPSTSLKIDAALHSIRIFDWLFVNQFVVARKKG
jgi:ubiquinone/menaquinone biosynthesis C-methylase UbiE